MRIFETNEEYNAYELENLLTMVNSQKMIYAVNFNDDTNVLNYKIVYGLNDVREKEIKLSDKEVSNQEILKQNILN